MPEYVKIRTENGDLVPFELDEEYDGPVRAGRAWNAAAHHAEESLESGVERVTHIAGAVAAKIGAMSGPKPDKVTVEIGLKADAEASLVIAKASTEAHIVISVEWQRDSLSTTSQNVQPAAP